MTPQERIDNYCVVTGYPRALMIGEDGRISGMWIMGNDYHVKSGYYGGYPATYLRRLQALFPDKQHTLHLFSGRVDQDAWPGDTVDSNADLAPTYCTDAQWLPDVPLANYDIVLADPPYSAEDAEHYGTTMVNRNLVMQTLHRCKQGTHVCWLDQVLPMFRKDWFTMIGVIGIVKSTNHRFRVLTIFERTQWG